MKGDFSRLTFDPRKNFSSVLMQQGRVQLDADWNEQGAILLHYVRTLVADLIGPHGGPGDGFKIEPYRDPDDFVILPGHYYVAGFLCENEGPLAYTGQPDCPLRENERLKRDATYLVYLDVWERHITCVEDERIREVALGGPDTTTRTKVVWQVIAMPIEPGKPETDEPADVKNCATLLHEKLAEPDKSGAARLRARAETRYRGVENHLYRVEVHYGSDRPGGPTFKWSRDNGSVAFPILAITKPTTRSSDSDRTTVTDTTTLTLEHLDHDGPSGLTTGDWVELVDDDYVLQGRVEPLWQVHAIDPANVQVTLTKKRRRRSKSRTSTSPISDAGQDPSKHPLLRRWDHRGGDHNMRGLQLHEGSAVIVEGEGEGENENSWLVLEKGVQIQFQKPAGRQPENRYCTGDYWLIPARTATGDIEWPPYAAGPEAVVPQGVGHQYAPLAIVSVMEDGSVSATDCRRKIKPLPLLTE